MTGLRFRVDNWRFWMTIAYVGISIGLVGAFVALEKASSEEAKRVAEQRASAIQQVTTCFGGVTNAPVVAGFIAGQKALISNSLDGNRAALKIKGEPAKLVKIRHQSITRLTSAETNVNILAALIKKTTPKKTDCIKLAVKTHVSYKQFLSAPPQHAERKP